MKVGRLAVFSHEVHFFVAIFILELKLKAFVAQQRWLFLMFVIVTWCFAFILMISVFLSKGYTLKKAWF